MEERAHAKEQGMRGAAAWLPVYFPRVACELSRQLHPSVGKPTQYPHFFSLVHIGGGAVRA